MSHFVNNCDGAINQILFPMTRLCFLLANKKSKFGVYDVTYNYWHDSSSILLIGDSRKYPVREKKYLRIDFVALIQICTILG